MDSSWMLVVAMSVGFISTLIQSLTGFGLSILSVPLFLMVYDAKEAVLIVQVLCIAVNLFFMFLVFKDIDFRFLKPLCISALVGQPVGLFVFQHASSASLKGIVSICIIVFLVLMFLYKKVIAETTGKTIVVGFLSGILTDSIGMSGPPLVLYLMGTTRSPVSIRATCIAYFAFVYIMSMGINLIGHVDYSYALEQCIYVLPACFAGLWAGHKLFPYLSPRLFKVLIYIVLILSAVYTLYSIL
jgi:uncharacterized membrane protein YfcA